jgi:hypothetical protein
LARRFLRVGLLFGKHPGNVPTTLTGVQTLLGFCFGKKTVCFFFPPMGGREKDLIFSAAHGREEKRSHFFSRPWAGQQKDLIFFSRPFFAALKHS